VETPRFLVQYIYLLRKNTKIQAYAVMSDLWSVIADMAVELHPDRINTIADKISALPSVDSLHKAPNGLNKSLVDKLRHAWQNEPGMSQKELAAALRGASITSSVMRKCEAVEMTWTGPSTGLVPIRHTVSVLREVIESANKKLFLVSFVAYNIGPIVKALKDAINRGVRVNILLEMSKGQGGKVDIDSIAAFKKEIPFAYIYTWNTEYSNGLKGSVHAKCAVADGKLAFVTSANLTKAAMENNMELGILVRGGHLPDQLSRHLEALVATEVIKQI
jgi:cardiolipin synthase A/B